MGNVDVTQSLSILTINTLVSKDKFRNRCSRRCIYTIAIDHALKTDETT